MCLDVQQVRCYACSQGIFRVSCVTDSDVRPVYLSSRGLEQFCASLHRPLYNCFDLLKVPEIQMVQQTKQFLIQFQDVLYSCSGLKRLFESDLFLGGEQLNSGDFSGFQVIQMLQKFEDRF